MAMFNWKSLRIGLMGAQAITWGMVGSMLSASGWTNPQDPPAIVSNNTNQDGQVPIRLKSEHIANVIRIHERVISGGVPEGESAFRELADWGIRTVVSVDGTKPDVEMARRYGLRYVHLPHGYNGIPPERVVELAKAVRDLEGPIFIHCHHGKHRSPAAASVACVSAGLIPETIGISILEFAGTNPHYQGLYEAARQARRIPAGELDSLKIEFNEVSVVPAMAEAMVEIDSVYENLQRIAAGNWESPTESQGLDPLHQSLLLNELFLELLRSPETKSQPKEFGESLKDSQMATQAIYETLKVWQPRKATGGIPPELSRSMKVIAENCQLCHQQFRD